MIKAVWAPQMCVFSRRVNLNKLNDIRYDVYERAITFDGPDFYSKGGNNSTTILKKILIVQKFP